MQRVNHRAEGSWRIDSAALGMLITVPVAILLWLMIIAAAYELSRWITAI